MRGCISYSFSPDDQLLLPDAINEVIAFAIDFTLDQAVDIGFEAREFFVEVTCKAQVIDDGLCLLYTLTLPTNREV